MLLIKDNQQNSTQFRRVSKECKEMGCEGLLLPASGTASRKRTQACKFQERYQWMQEQQNARLAIRDTRYVSTSMIAPIQPCNSCNINSVQLSFALLMMLLTSSCGNNVHFYKTAMRNSWTVLRRSLPYSNVPLQGILDLF